MIFEHLVLLSLLGIGSGEPEAKPGILYAAAPEDRGQFHITGKRTYNYGYNTGDGIAKVETKQPDGTITGSYRFYDPYGRQVVRSYIADENGFRVLGNDLPISPNTPAVGHIGSQTLTAPVEGAPQFSNVNIIPPSRADIVLQDGSIRSSNPCDYSDCSSTRRSCSGSRSNNCRTSSSSDCSSSMGRNCRTSSSRSCSNSGGSSCSSSRSAPATSSRCSSSCSSSSRRCCSASFSSCCSSTRRSCCSSSPNCSSRPNCCPSPCTSSNTYSQYFHQMQREREEAIRKQDDIIRRQEEHLTQLRAQKRKLEENTNIQPENAVPNLRGPNYFYASDKVNYDFPAGFVLNYKGTRFRPLYVKKERPPYTIGRA